MANPTVVKFAKPTADALTETGNASIAAVALTDSGNSPTTDPRRHSANCSAKALFQRRLTFEVNVLAIYV
jgi:hypothetical protein